MGVYACSSCLNPAHGEIPRGEEEALAGLGVLPGVGGGKQLLVVKRLQRSEEGWPSPPRSAKQAQLGWA